MLDFAIIKKERNVITNKIQYINLWDTMLYYYDYIECAVDKKSAIYICLSGVPCSQREVTMESQFCCSTKNTRDSRLKNSFSLD